MTAAASETAPARIEYLKARNFRVLRDVAFRDLTPMTVLLGPNGSGKSTVFDVFAFLAECFASGPAARLGTARTGRGDQDPRRRRPGNDRDQIPRAAGNAADYLPFGRR